MYVAYELRNDRLALDQLRATHGLVGFDDWWAQIESGALPVHRVIGAVSGYWPGQWAAGPAEFELKEPNGDRSMWDCGLEPPNATFAFRIGRPVEVRYVLQDMEALRGDAGGRASKTMISILLGDDFQAG